MNTINFIQTGGVPFTNDVAQEFENAYKIFNAYGALAGDKTIISGCVENGSSVSDGFIYVNNELFYFEGGSKSDNIFLNVQNIDKVFEDQTTKTLIKIRTLKFGNAIDNVWAWSDFKRIDTMLSLMLRLDTLEAAQTITNAKLAIFTQGGVVFPWFKSVDDIPEGFAHGFVTLEDNTIFQYKCTNWYNPSSEGSILWNDPALNIQWNVEEPVLSAKDKLGQLLADFNSPFV